ncbi:glutamine amidotransferase [Myxococcus sp. K38C18041901]|uniref:type 1 glutamine amidotransferase family protein n=1 Tax=Myxococcus guangdongensis TaxID=2906760 RepID=UPI0020A82737|nr:type 1 glutamine amidotransferase family protein [Myxococcus guangdongensis]MCP3059083.1 glutamine amidotransferase [Myxococcus guangdongensis]
MAHIAFVVIPPFADWEPGLLAASAREDFRDEVSWWSPGGRPVPSIGGLTVQVDGAVEDLSPDKMDALVLIGSGTWMTPESPDLTSLLRHSAEVGRVVAGICGATLALARAGLLDGRAHTSNDLEFLQKHAPGYQGVAHYRDVPQAVRDGNIITASGAAPTTFATEVLGALHPHSGRTVQELRAFFAREHQAT